MPKKNVKRPTNTQKLQQQQTDSDDSSWEDNDKKLQKKNQRKEELMKKRKQQLAKKAETKKLLEEETKQLKGGKTQKITRTQIRSNLTCSVSKNRDNNLPENLNKVISNEEVASNVDEALSLFEEKSIDKHPEKRRKAAFIAFESRRIKELRSERPELKLSQIKEMVFKEWQKSSENPMNNEKK